MTDPTSPGWRYETGCIVDADNQIIATVCGDDVKRGELLAASNDLLSALVECVEVYEKHRDSFIPSGMFWPDPNHIHHARMAIRRAGRSEVTR